jgi:hypothetical protein
MTRIWMGGEGRGRGGEKDDGTTIVVCGMGNIRAYLPAMMTGGRLPPGNDDGGYEVKEIPVIQALDLGKAADHFLAVAVWLLAFLSSSSLSLRVAAAAGQRGDWGFVAVSVANDDDGIEQKR